MIIAMSSCIEQKILFKPGKDINRDFLSKVPGLGTAPFIKYPVIKAATNINIYLCSFREKMIVKNDLLQATELSDSRNPAGSFQDVLSTIGNTQEIYLVNYEFTYSAVSKKTGKTFAVPAQAALLFTIKYDARGDVLAIRPAYFGVVNDEDSLIAFITELAFKKINNQFYLEPVKEKNTFGLEFLPVVFPAIPDSASTLNIKQILMSYQNKVGGTKPLVFNIDKIFGYPNALEFHYYRTIHLTQ